jgi:hypothetical protein
MRARLAAGARIALLVTTLAAPSAWAQGAAISTLLDASVRAAGMGRSSNAVFWGGDPDYWGNPALLGYHQGLRYEWGKTQLVPDLADDVYFDTDRFTLAAFGVGLFAAGNPTDGLGGLDLSYGMSEATGPGGEPLGTFESFERIESWGVGISLATLLDAVLPLTGARLPALARWGDVALGYASKEVEVSLAPDLPTLPPGSGWGAATPKDKGIFLRATPYNSLDYPGSLPGLDRLARCRLDLSYGGSTLNYNDATIVFGDRPDRVLPVTRHGFAVRLAAGLPRAVEKQCDDQGLGWLVRSLTPLLAAARAWDDEHIVGTYLDPDLGPVQRESTTEKSGWEFSLLNVFSYRSGRIDDPDGSIHGNSNGWSLGLSYDGLAGFRYDHATVPQASDPEYGIYLSDVTRKAWTFYVDPVRICQGLR